MSAGSVSGRSPAKEHDPTARILNVQRMSTHDGPGIRTTVFFKGCPLACTWCQNPESLSARPELVWHAERCIGCRGCLTICPAGASLCADRGRVRPATCTTCGQCAGQCPTVALEVLGQRWTLEDLVAEVVKDRAYFEASGGGVTLSGGEPAAQAPFAVQLMQRCRELGLHVALDTCGQCTAGVLRRLLSDADLLLFDLKVMDPRLHERYTGQPNETILENLLLVRDHLACGPQTCELWIRTPLVPAATATEENIRQIGAFLARELPLVVARWELCAFHNLCRAKYQALGLTWSLGEVELLTEQELEHLALVARQSGIRPEIVCASGPTRVFGQETPNAASAKRVQ